MRKFILVVSIILCIFNFVVKDVSAEDKIPLGKLIKITKEKIRKVDRVQKYKMEQEGPQSIKKAPRQYVRTIQAQYLGTVTQEQYPAEEKGPTAATILDPYHPKHKGMSVPYFKNREGLKIFPWLGIRSEYKQDEKLVGIESLILEAKEFGETTDSQLRDYISTNDKHYSRGEVILHYKETWPKFTFIHHNERVTRQYGAKERNWSSNDIYYDNYDRKYYKLNYTIPNLPRIGYLDITGRYGSIRGFRPNDNAAYASFDSYMLTFRFLPYDVATKIELHYLDIEKPRYSNEDGGEEYALLVETNFNFPRHYLRIKPHYKWEDEEYFPVTGNSEWVLHKGGVRIEKDINGKLGFMTDWTYIDYARDKNREKANYEHISLKALEVENNLTYEIIQDVKFALGLDYQSGFSFDGFDNYTIRGELSYRKPGLADYRIGLRHTEYYNIDDAIDTLYFKIGLFM